MESGIRGFGNLLTGGGGLVGAEAYAVFGALREQAPVVRMDNLPIAIVGRYEEVGTVLKDWESFSSGMMRGLVGSSPGSMGSTMIFADPPDHTRLRGVVAKAFTPKSVQALEPRIREITRTLLAELQPGEPFDVVERFTVPLPITVIAEMLGVDPADRADFKRWSNTLVGFAEIARPSVATELQEYFLRVIAERQREPKDDLISRMVIANAEDTLSPEEIMGACVLLLIAGNETTTNLLGQAILALRRHPEQHRKLVDDPSLIPNAIEETLRWDGPVLAVPPRSTTRDVQLGGETLPAGTPVMPILGAANRDPRKFDDPDTYDVTRPNAAAHVAFGGGVHYCLGAPLARLESRVALEELLAFAPNFDLADPDTEPEYDSNFFLRSVKRLEIVLG